MVRELSASLTLMTLNCANQMSSGVLLGTVRPHQNAEASGEGGMGDLKPTMVPPGYTDSRSEEGPGEYVPGFLKLAEKVCSEGRVLHAVVDCPVDTE